MSYPPKIDPYAVLGVPKDVNLPEIKSAHRKLVLKYHPDKVKDESQRSRAQDEFQRVQQAYELLSDETARTKYDREARLAELKEELTRERERTTAATGSAPYTSPQTASREYRNGRIYEERVPTDEAFFFGNDDDDLFWAQEPRQTSRKHDASGKRQRPKFGFGTEEKRRPRPYGFNFDFVKVSTRTSGGGAKTSYYSGRDKVRTKERKQEASAKPRAAYVESEHEDEGDDGAYNSDASSVDARPRRSSQSKQNRAESVRYNGTMPRKSKYESSRKSDSRRSDDDYADGYDKHDNWQHEAQIYIKRTKGTVPADTSRRTRASRSPPHSGEPDSHSSRRSGRERHRVSARNNSREHLETEREQSGTPPLRRQTTAPGGHATPPPPNLPRTYTMPIYGTQLRRDRSGRYNSVLSEMADAEVPPPPPPPKSSKMRFRERQDSGYSSPGTPDMQSEFFSKARYRMEPEAFDSEPSSPPPRRHRNYSTGHPVRGTPKPNRASTFHAYPPESPLRYEYSRTKPFFHEAEYVIRPKDQSKHAPGSYFPLPPYYDGYRISPGSRPVRV